MINNLKIFRIIIISTLLLLNFACQFRFVKNEQIIDKIIAEGNTAYQAKQYDKALSLFDEGLKIAPHEPSLLGNKAVVLVARTVEKYNTSRTNVNPESREQFKAEIGKDFQDAANLANSAIDELNRLQLSNSEPIVSLRHNIYLARADSLRLLATISDAAKTDEALKAMYEYIEIEPAQDKKIKMRLVAGRMLIETQKPELAVAEYKNILAFDEKNVEAILGIGMALAQAGNKEQLQESKKYLEDYLKLAPPEHPQMQTAKEILRSLQNGS